MERFVGAPPQFEVEGGQNEEEERLDENARCLFAFEAPRDELKGCLFVDDETPFELELWRFELLQHPYREEVPVARSKEMTGCRWAGVDLVAPLLDEVGGSMRSGGFALECVAVFSRRWGAERGLAPLECLESPGGQLDEVGARRAAVRQGVEPFAVVGLGETGDDGNAKGRG
jgi:hypothetical protein